MAQKDYYQILGVDRKASQQQIRMAYRKLAFQFHPDHNKEHPESAMRMKEINESYAVISDETKRAQYDAIQRSHGRSATDRFREKYSERDIYSGSDIHRVFEEFSKNFGLRGFDEIFREVYGSGFRSFQHRTKRTPRASDQGPSSQGKKTKPRADIMERLRKYSINKTFPIQWPVRGKDRSLSIRVDPKAALLGGKIKYVDRREKRELVIKIPARVRDGQQIRLKGMGARGKDNGKRGDLYIKVHVGRPPFQMIKGALRRLFFKTGG